MLMICMIQQKIYRRMVIRPLLILLCFSGLAACGNKSDHIRELQQQVWQNPDDAEAYLRLGKGYARLQRFDEAVEAYRRAIALEPGLDEAYSALGASLFNQKKFAEALPYIKKRVETAPDDSLRHFDLGNVYMNLKQYDNAVLSYRQAIDNSYSFDEAYYNLAVALARAGKSEDAWKIHTLLQQKNNYLAVSLERHLNDSKPDRAK